MTTQTTESVANQIQSLFNPENLFNPRGSQDVIKMWAQMSENMTAIIIDAGTKSTDIMSNATKEALSNLGEATQVRDEPAEYSKAYGDYAKKQMDLLTRTAQEVGEVTQKAGAEMKELSSEAGEKMRDKVSESTKRMTDKGTEAAKTAADKAAATAKDVSDKASSTDKKSA